jgi:hypothetical protein
MPNIDDFKSRLIGGGARPNLFKVTCNFPGYAGGDVELTSFMCKAASLPASTIGNIDVPYRGRVIKVAGDRTFEPWTLTIINDNNFVIRDSFEAWMNAINEHQNNTGILAPADYYTDMAVEQLDRQENVVKKYDIRGAYPSNVAAIELAYDSNDQVEEFTVELQFNYWESNTTS